MTAQAELFFTHFGIFSPNSRFKIIFIKNSSGTKHNFGVFGNDLS